MGEDSVEQADQTLTFTLLGETSFTYTVTAPSTGDTYTFSGTLVDDQNGRHTIADTTVTVTAPAVSGPSASRGLPSLVDSGANFTVSISAMDYGLFADVVETLPEGFTYVSNSLGEDSVEQADQTLTFTLLGETSFTYTVTAPSTAETYTFMGTLVDDQDTSHTIADSMIEVSGPSASRGLPSRVSPGANFTVAINTTNYGLFADVVETLPEGFTYVANSLGEGSVEQADQTLTFTLLGETSFTYTVTAPSTANTYTFMGTLVDDQDTSHTIADSSIRVGSPPSGGGGGGGFGGGGADTNLAPSFRAGAEATRVVAENASPGTAVGDRVTAFDNDGDSITYSIEGDDASLFAIDQTGQVSVAEGAALDYEAAISHAVTLRVSDGRGKSDTIAVTITVTNVEETGTVTLSSASPEIGTALTATLADPDGGVSNVAWRWDRSADRTTWITIVGASSATYTPTEADGGQYLRATAAYNDNHGANKWAHMVSANAVPVAATPTPEPTPTPPPAPTATPAPEPTPTPPPAATATPAPEPTPTPPPPAPTATPAPEPTPTPPPPAPTAAPPPVPTATAAPEPTATPAPPAPTVAPPVLEEDDGGFAVWGIVLIILAGLALVAGVVYWTRMRST